MNKRFLMTIAVIAGLILPCVVVKFSPVLAQTGPEIGPFVITAVIRRGDPRVGGGTFLDCDACDMNIAGEHGLNDEGQVVISGFAGNCGFGVYVVSGRTGFPVVDACHLSPFGRLGLFVGANINNRGQVALNMGPVVDNRTVDMITLFSDGQFTKIAAHGDQGPTGKAFGDCGFSLPSINDRGDIAFSACFQDGQGIFAGNGVFVYSEGLLRKIAVGEDPSPLGGAFAFVLDPPPRVSMNENGDVLFMAGQIDPDITAFERFGLFLAAADGIKKIELSKDTMPNGSKAADNSIGLGSLNNNAEVVFGLGLTGKPKVGIFLYSGGQTSTIILHDEPSPIGGTFDLLQEVDDLGGPRVNDNGTVAFMANVAGDKSTEGIFLASPKAIIKVVAIGDRLPTGEKIRGINSFALNNLGQVAFFANGSDSILNPNPLGVFLATPNPPQINSIKLKHKKNVLQLRVNGNAMITNDTVIEINGVPLGAIDYPTDFREDGGATTRVVGRDSRLEQLIPAGQTVQVTVYNSLTNLRSTSVAFTR
jgi:hypothetical protein